MSETSELETSIDINTPTKFNLDFEKISQSNTTKSNTTCPKGYIKRVGYIRHMSSGKKVKVEPNCIMALSQSGEKRTDIDKVIMGRRRIIHKMARNKFGTPRCKSGEIIREGYKKKSHKRSSYTKRSGSKNIKIKESEVKGAWVKPRCIKSVSGRSTKQKQLFVLDKNVLGKFGYHNLESITEAKRKKALKKAIKSGLKPLSIYRRMVAIATLQKNTNPHLHDIIMTDADWLKTLPEYLNRESVRAKSK
jgi:Family of unknown function (DUF5771)